MESLGVTQRSLPTVRITKHTDDLVKYKPEGNDVTEDIMRSFIADFMAGKVEPHLNSQELPDDWDTNPVKILVASNFEKVTSDPSKNVFVKFYAPWCGHCKQVAPIWEKLGESMVNEKDIMIAQMDMTANEMKSLEVKGFPTFKLYKAAMKQVLLSMDQGLSNPSWNF